MYVKVHAHAQITSKHVRGDGDLISHLFSTLSCQASGKTQQSISGTKRRQSDCVFACTWVSVLVCPFSAHGSAGFGDVWSEILNATDFYALTTNQLFTIHTSGSYSVTVICSLFLSLCFLLSSYWLSQFHVLSLPLCVAFFHRSHTRDTFKVIFGEDCRCVNNSDFVCLWVVRNSGNGDAQYNSFRMKVLE